jgi:hypothetical protein
MPMRKWGFFSHVKYGCVIMGIYIYMSIYMIYWCSKPNSKPTTLGRYLRTIDVNNGFSTLLWMIHMSYLGYIGRSTYNILYSPCLNMACTPQSGLI